MSNVNIMTSKIEADELPKPELRTYDDGHWSLPLTVAFIWAINSTLPLSSRTLTASRHRRHLLLTASSTSPSDKVSRGDSRQQTFLLRLLASGDAHWGCERAAARRRVRLRREGVVGDGYGVAASPTLPLATHNTISTTTPPEHAHTRPPATTVHTHILTQTHALTCEGSQRS